MIFGKEVRGAVVITFRVFEQVQPQLHRLEFLQVPLQGLQGFSAVADPFDHITVFL